MQNRALVFEQGVGIGRVQRRGLELADDPMSVVSKRER